MISNPAELAMQRRQTAAFIEANHEVITLIPQMATKTGTGGRTTADGDARTPQKFQVIERMSTARTDSRVSGGKKRVEEYTLLGLYDAVIEPGDRFDYLGDQWEVQELEWDNGYERRAAVMRHGR